MFKYDANKAADDFLRVLWDHHPEAAEARSSEELLGYVAMDLIAAFQREGIVKREITKALDYAVGFADLHPATPHPGYFNPEPTPPTFDEALGAKCDIERRLEEARALK